MPRSKNAGAFLNLNEEQYKEFFRLSKTPCGIVREIPQDSDVLTKAMSIGLADVRVRKSKNGSRAAIGFAKDLPDILKPLSSDVKKKTYRKLKKFSEKLGNLVLVYGMIDFDSLYKMFREIYRETLSGEEIYRGVYWYARINDQVNTAYDSEGKSYVCAYQLDMKSIFADLEKYADHLDYVMFPAAEIRRMAGDIGARSKWLCILFLKLRSRFGFSESMASTLVEEVFTAAMNGDPLSAVLDIIFRQMEKSVELVDLCDLWECMTAFMLETELPMLKGRSRIQYAEETGKSPWETGMFEEIEFGGDAKELPMHGFPQEIQETMYRACSFADRQDMEQLWRYQEKEKIQSEEFLCLLAEAHTTGCEFGRAEKLIRKLKRSSLRGKRAADVLMARLDDGMDVMDDMDDDFYPWYTEEQATKIVPYVREKPKIGRNDPCPCGSGKKYKKCCGKNQ